MVGRQEEEEDALVPPSPPPECVTLKGTFLYSVLIQTDFRWHRGFSEALLDYLFMVGGWNASASPDLPSYSVSQLLITSLPPNTTHLQFKAAKPISIAGYITISINIITIFEDEESLRGMREGWLQQCWRCPNMEAHFLKA